MRLLLGPLALLPALALAVSLSWLTPPPALAATATVTIFDGDTPPPTNFDPSQGWWGYAPYHVEVKRGDPIVFHNPSTNRFPHTVTSITHTGSTYESGLAAGAQFDSTPDANSRIMPGESWTLDTSSLDPGHYAYYCRLHLWMLGSFTVTQ